MTSQLIADGPDERGLEPIPVPVDAPEGFWIREASHAPLPWTPFSRLVLGEARSRGIARAYAEFGVLFETLEFRQIGGWEYARVVPLSGTRAWEERAAVAVAAVRSDFSAAVLDSWPRRLRPRLAARTAALRRVDLARLDDAGLGEHLREALALADDGLLLHFRLHLPIALALAELTFICRDLFGWDEAAVLELLAGTSTTSTAPARALVELAALAAERPTVRRLLADNAPADAVLAADERFRGAYEDYQREYGARALSYELADPCLDDQPELALGLVRDQLAAGVDLGAADEANRARRAAACAEGLRLLTGRDSQTRGRFDRALNRALLAYPVREDNEFFTVSAPFAVVHRVVRAAGRRLAAAGLLESAEDAFYLEPAVLLTALGDGVDCRAAARRAIGERAWTLAHPGPASYGTPPPHPHRRWPSCRW
jgi:pyruvate,water dikinase